MKLNRTLLVAGLFGAFNAAVLAQSTNLNVSASESKTQMKPVYPPVQYKIEAKAPKTETAPAEKDKIAQYGNASSQAWTTIATRRENPTAFHDCRTHEPQLVAVSIGPKTK
jgi:hypothetical protein